MRTSEDAPLKILDVPDAVVKAVEDSLDDFGHTVSGDCAHWVAYEAILAWLTNADTA